VSLRAHTDALQILADKDVTVISVNEEIRIQASTKIEIVAGQSSLVLEAPDQQDDSALIGGGSRDEPVVGDHGRIRQEVRHGNEPGPVSSGAADARILRELRDA
jgi:hypothetical protein